MTITCMPIKMLLDSNLVSVTFYIRLHDGVDVRTGDFLTTKHLLFACTTQVYYQRYSVARVSRERELR